MVDSDEDLVALCSRVQASDNKHLAILFCEDAGDVPPSSARPPLPSKPEVAVAPPNPRAYH